MRSAGATRLLGALVVAATAVPAATQAAPAGSAGLAMGVSWMNGAKATSRTAAWSGGVRADLHLADYGPVRVRGEVASLHLAADGATETIAVDTGYHAVMLMGSVALRAGSFESYLAAGPVAWLITTDIRVDTTEESFSHTAYGLGGLVGVRAADGPFAPRVELGAATRAGRTAVFGAVGVSWVWAAP